MYDFDFDKFPPPPIYDIIPIDVIMKNAQESQRVEAVSDSIQTKLFSTKINSMREAKKHFNKKDDDLIKIYEEFDSPNLANQKKMMKKELLCGFHT